MAKVLADHPAVIDDDVPLRVEPLDREQGTVVEPVASVGGIPVRGYTQAVAHSEFHSGRPVDLETSGLVERQRPLTRDQALSALVAIRMLVELEHVARVVARLLSSLRFRHV